MDDREQLRSILDNSTQMIQVSDPESMTLVYANETAKKQFGNGEEPGEHIPCYKYMMGLDEQCPFCPLRENKEDESASSTAEYENGDQVFGVEAVVTEWNGRRAVTEYVHDITEQKRAERIYRSQLDALMLSVNDAQMIFYVDVTEGKTLLTEGTSYKVKNVPQGTPFDTLVVKISAYITDEDDRVNFVSSVTRENLIKAYDEGKSQLTYDLNALYNDGTIRPSRVVIRLSVNPVNEHLDCVIYGIDITDETSMHEQLEKAFSEQTAQLRRIQSLNEELEERQVQLERAACEQEEQIEKITALNIELENRINIIKAMNKRQDEANAVIEAFSREYHTIWLVDKATLRVSLIRSTGRYSIAGALKIVKDNDDYDEVTRRYIDKYVEPVDHRRTSRETESGYVLKRLEVNGMYAVNYLRRNESGDINYHQITYIDADTDAGRKQFLCGFRDIDEIILEERKLKNELSEAKKNAEVANRAKTVFLNNMSHDIRTPMNAILGFTRLMKEHKNEPEVIEDYLAKIEKSGDYLLNIINNVLEVARIDSGNETVDECFTDLMDDSCRVDTMLENEFRRKNLTFENKMDIQHRYVYADMNKIREITMNVMSNAIKYTPEGGQISLTFVEEPSDREGFGKYVNTVSDTGIGMAPEFLAHIFDSFSRERNTTESKISGTGLGMSIVKKLTDLMGGTVEVESEPGKGTTFRLTFYHRLVQNPEEFIKKQTENRKTTVDLKNRHILLAEDNELNAEIAVEILKEMGAVIDVAADGVECVDKLDKAEAGQYDFILMDIQMPHLNGYEATERIRAFADSDKAMIPIIAVTANAFEEDRKAAARAGMDGHISKPIMTDELIKTLTEVMTKKGML